MIKMPLARFSKFKYIQSLQNGLLYFRHNMYYQRLEDSDVARSDRYDGSIPCEDNGFLSREAGKPIYNPRIMNLCAYILCFYHFHCEHDGIFYIPKEDKEALQSFDCDTAIVIDCEKFEDRLHKVCERNGLSVEYRDVQYCTNSDYNLIGEMLHRGCIPDVLKHPQFLKHSSFKNQSEYRVSIRHKPSVLIQNPNAMVLNQNETAAKELYESTYILDIGPIDSFSKIVPSDELLKDD